MSSNRPIDLLRSAAIASTHCILCRREYYERNNYLIQQYSYIDRLLDSSLPHNLIQEYQPNGISIPPTIDEEQGSGSPSAASLPGDSQKDLMSPITPSSTNTPKLKRTPKNLYHLPDEGTPLLTGNEDDPECQTEMPPFQPEEETDSQSPIVRIAIYVNLTANIVLLIMKLIVAYMTASLSVLASLVDAALDFLSTAIVFATTRMIAQQDHNAYPVGRRRLEPIGVLVFSVIMITSFAQVSIQGLQKLMSDDHSLVQLTISAIAIMAATVAVKGLCWVWCRLIRNSSVQALAQDAMTDVVFNIFSIFFPLGMSSVPK